MITSSTHGINPSLYGAQMPFDPVKDFAPITLAAELKNVVVVNPQLPVKDIPELVSYLRANPGKVSFGSAGIGTSQHLAGEMFKLMTKTDMTHVAYRGAAAAVPDLLKGDIQLMFVSIPDVVGHIEAGRLRPIAVTSKTRSDALPQVTPIAEQGFPEFDVRAWFAVAAPAGTPPAIVARFNRDIATALKRPEVQERLKTMGMDPATSTPEELQKHIAAEVEKWAPVVKASGATIN
jgi:tripartite-type tricarboxylate transporter receptor subunit TctC